MWTNCSQFSQFGGDPVQDSYLRFLNPDPHPRIVITDF